MITIQSGFDNFSGNHAGARCALLCNGESLKTFPITFERYPYDTIGINRSWELCPSRYHFVLSLPQLQAQAAHKGWKMPSDCLFVGINRDNHEENKAKYEEAKKVHKKGCVFIAGRTQNDCVTRGLGFAMNLETENPWMPNTPYLALQFIRWMGYKHVDIWGLDLTGPKFWDPNWRMTEGHAGQQNDFLKYAAGVLANDGVTVINRNPESKCTAFPKEGW